GAEVILNGVHWARTDESGRYYFRGVPPGAYTVRFSSAGFQATVIDGIPVRQDRVTNVDGVLMLGTVSEAVSVLAAPTFINTESSSLMAIASGITAGTAFAPPAAMSTPRVREYFPETLFWNPELITNASGRA